MNKKILIVEDDQIVANIYRNKFSVEGYEVEVALDGQSGMEMLRSFRPDAVVLDLMLPKMTGVDFMKQIRAQSDFQKLPIIVFSNTYLTNMVQEAWKAGATKCLSKANCSPKQLLDVVRGTLTANGTAVTPQSNAAQNPAASAEAKVPAPKPGPTDVDKAFQAELRQEFARGLPAALGAMRTFLQALIKS